MSKDQIPETNTEPTSAGLKRRDLLLSGSALVAASALCASATTSNGARTRRAKAEHLRHHERRHLKSRRVVPLRILGEFGIKRRN